jgi:hypothetical protein
VQAVQATSISSRYTYSTQDSNWDGLGDAIAEMANGSYMTSLNVGEPQWDEYWGTEHRGNVSFSVPSLSGKWIQSAYLHIPNQWYKLGGGTGRVDLYAFQDDGQRNASDFQRLDYLVTTSLVPDQTTMPGPINANIVSALQRAADNGWSYLGFTLENASVPGGGGIKGCGWYGSSVTLEYTATTAYPALTTSPAAGGIVAFDSVRVGTSASNTITVTNTGNPGSSLTGTFPAVSGDFAPAGTASFGPLAQNASSNRSYFYTPSSRGTDNRQVTVTGYGGSSRLTLTGTGVGPVFSSTVADSTIDFGSVSLGDTASLPLSISNATSDIDLGDLTDLTLLSASLTGPDASLFSLVGFTPATILAKNAAADLQIEFNSDGTSPGLKSAMLTFSTDQGAAFGVAGDSISFSLNGIVTVPEPSCRALTIIMGLCLVGLLRQADRRRPSHCQTPSSRSLKCQWGGA